MNPELLLAHFDRISDAPEAIRHFRQFIIDLSVRGKLVEQDPSDEPAFESLKRVRTERKRLSKGKIVKNDKIPGEIQAIEKPYSLPGNWQWIRLGESLDMINGRAFKPTDWIPSGLPIVRIQNLNTENAPFNYCNESIVEQRHMVESGCFLISWSGTPGTSFGAFIWKRGRAALNQHIFRCVQVGGAYYDRFLQIAINGRLDEMIAKAHGGVGLQHITKGKLENLPLSLPPLAEQYRIVAKVDELMALCDRLEATQREREVRQNRLTAASHHFLSTGTNLDAIRKHAGFFFSHLPCLTTCQDHVQQLRESIRNLAIRGRLVRQDPTDGSASQAVREIAQNKGRLYAAKKIPKPTQLPIISESDMLFTTPNGWCWTMLGDLCYQVSDGPHFSPQYVGPQEGVPFLSTRNVRLGSFDLSSLKYISHKDHEAFSKRIRPEKGDILYTKGGTTGLAKVNDLDFQFSVWVHLAVLRIDKERLLPRYVELALNSPHCYAQSQRYTQGISNFDLGLTRMVKITIPLPPLAEQHRIVAKADELMALCDRLEAQLTTAKVESSLLLEAVLHNALRDSTSVDRPAQTTPAIHRAPARSPSPSGFDARSEVNEA